MLSMVPSSPNTLIFPFPRALSTAFTQAEVLTLGSNLGKIPFPLFHLLSYKMTDQTARLVSKLFFFCYIHGT